MTAVSADWGLSALYLWQVSIKWATGQERKVVWARLKTLEVFSETSKVWQK